MQPDLWSLYTMMFQSRLVEEEVARLWREGKISGEMHLGIGEEGIVAGVVSHLREGDALALDHRGTSPLVMRGVGLPSLFYELLGDARGLCRGRGGHMHLLWKEKLAASSGIVGASGPSAVGFAMAGRRLRPRTIAVAFFGEGAMNQGMMMESLNLAAVWKLPVLFVCKDSKWAITTESTTVTAGRLTDRAQSFGMPAFEVDGSDVETVWNVAGQAIDRARLGKGPAFLYAHCVRPEGHFLGDPLLRMARHPIREMKTYAGPLLKSLSAKQGGSFKDRITSIVSVGSSIAKTVKGELTGAGDPVEHLRKKLSSEKHRLDSIESEVRDSLSSVLAALDSGPDSGEVQAG